MELKIDAKSGILYRENSFDSWIVNESRSYFPAGILSSDVVLDIGAHIGCFSARARMEAPTCQILAVEPEQTNFEVLQENAAKFSIDSIRAAVVGTVTTPKISLFVNQKKNNALHSTVPVRGRPTQEVDTQSFSVLLEKIEPTVVKIDIEGAEYDFNYSLLSSTKVRLVIMELHLTKKGFPEKAREVVAQLSASGFTAVKVPSFEGKRWTTIGTWIRN